MYDAKPKRKREDIPSITDYLLDFLTALARAGRAGLRGLWRVLAQCARWTWRGTRWTLRGSTRALIFTGGLLWTTTVWTLRLPWRMLRGLWRWWNGPHPYFESERERDIYYRIRRHFRRRRRHRLHVFAYVLVNISLWAQFASRPYPLMFYPERALWSQPVWGHIVFTAAWSVILLFHYLHLRSAEAEDQAIEEALERERFYADRQHEARYIEDNARYARLTDDGEIVDEYDDDPHMKRKRR